MFYENKDLDISLPDRWQIYKLVSKNGEMLEDYWRFLKINSQV